MEDEDDPNTQDEYYKDAVIRCRALIIHISDYQFDIGEWAHNIETRYGENTFYQFAAEIGIDVATLRAYRATYRKWKDQPAHPKSFSVARALNMHPQKYEIWQEYRKERTELDEILDRDGMSVGQAKREMKRWREEQKDAKGVHIKQLTKSIIKEIDGFLALDSRLMEKLLKLKEYDHEGAGIDEVIRALQELARRVTGTYGKLKATILAPAD